MKRLINIIFLMCTFIFVGAIHITNVKAASGTINARSSSSSVILGNSVTVTITVSSASAIGSWEFVVNYDTSKLKLTSTNNATYIVDYGNGSKKSASYTYTFKTIAEGKATVSIKNASIIDYVTENEMSTTTSGCTISINKEVIVPKSTNANLSALTVSEGTLTPAFDPNTTNYTVDINNLIDKITITPTKADSKATINGGGELNVSEGANAFNITVTAENGTSKVYNITINIIDSNPIKVTIDGAEYTVVKKAGTIEIPNNYKETSIPISGVDVVAYNNTNNGLTLVGLKDKDGKTNLYVYDSSKETYTLYNEFRNNASILYLYKPASNIKIPGGYKKASLTINDKNIYAWSLKHNKSEDYYLVYGMNVETGKTSFYSYDKKEGTFQRYIESVNNPLKSTLDMYFIIIIVVASLFIIMVSLFIYNLLASKRLKKV